MKPLRVLLLIAGSLVALIGFGLLAAGAGLGRAVATERDDDGFFTTPFERFESDSFAITSDRIDLGEPGPDDWWSDRDLATVRVTADDTETGRLFIGIGPEADVEAYLAGVPHDEVDDLEFGPFVADYRRENSAGTARPGPPDAQEFWVAQSAGEATQRLTWDPEPGDWAIVVMNADGTEGVSADIELGAQLSFLVPVAVGLGIAGALAIGLGAALILGGVVGRHPDSRLPAGDLPPPVSGLGPDDPGRRQYPLRLEAELDSHLSRWRWLIKWLLVIPHAIVLAFLWVAFVVLTLVAFFAILFTGRYPRSIFDFNVGVLRWTWRVSYYATSALGTDQYPPFTLEPAEYPATLTVDYPEHLSRRLVLVKSWLLAIPHLLIVGVFSTTMKSAADNGAQFVFSGGLLGILVLIAALALAFSGSYPTGLFNLIMGINRWTYRVIAYVALMTDDYPPFHLDQGGRERSAVQLTSPQVNAT